MGLQGCSCLERHKGHVVILLYFFLFGTGFLASSSLYLSELYKIDAEPVPECVLGLLTQQIDQGDNSTTTVIVGPGGRLLSDCADVSWWRTIAWVGLIYGSICILAGLAKFFPILKRLCSCGAAAAAKRLRRRRSRGTSLRAAAGGRVVSRANAEVRQFVQDRASRSSSSDAVDSNWSSCSQFTRICLKFIIIMNLWLTAIIMPWYIAANVFNSDGIRAKNANLYYPALSLFAISIVSLAVTFASCIFLVIEHDPGSWDDDEDEEERDGKKVVTQDTPEHGGPDDEDDDVNVRSSNDKTEVEEPLNPTPNSTSSTTATTIHDIKK